MIFLFLFGQSFNTNILLELNSRIFVHEDGTWAVKGRFENALEDDEDVTWTFDDGHDTLRVLIISSLYFLKLIF